MIEATNDTDREQEEPKRLDLIAYLRREITRQVVEWRASARAAGPWRVTWWAVRDYSHGVVDAAVITGVAFSVILTALFVITLVGEQYSTEPLIPAMTGAQLWAESWPFVKGVMLFSLAGALFIICMRGPPFPRQLPTDFTIVHDGKTFTWNPKGDTHGS